VDAYNPEGGVYVEETEKLDKEIAAVTPWFRHDDQVHGTPQWISR
tara:strand:+ start:334 stop:468 length:135 start_codon:yes stop_codon:yes gene_type:complete